jgi:hypothetical protein
VGSPVHLLAAKHANSAPNDAQGAECIEGLAPKAFVGTCFANAPGSCVPPCAAQVDRDLRPVGPWRKLDAKTNRRRISSTDYADLRRFFGRADFGFSESVKICVNLWMKFPAAIILAAAREAAMSLLDKKIENQRARRLRPAAAGLRRQGRSRSTWNRIESQLGGRG